MTLISIGDAELHVDIAGSGPPLFLVSGLGGRGTFWANQIAALAEQFQVITYDHRGVGRSPHDGVARSTLAMADDQLRLMDALGIARAHLVGHSTGGALAQHVAARAPGRVERLVLSASWAAPSPLFLATFAMRRRVLTGLGAESYLLLSAVLGYPAAWLDPRFSSSAAFVAARLDQFPSIEHELTRLDAVTSHNATGNLSAISAPTLVLCAADDQLTPPAESRALADGIAGARTVILPSGGHFCPQTEPALYNRHLLAFLRGNSE